VGRSRLIGIGVAVLVLAVIMSFTGPDPEFEATSEITRVGGVCLQMEQWGMFGWVIVGQTYSEQDIARAEWRTPPSSNPPCEDTPEVEQQISLPPDAQPDVYRICGLADELGCLTFTLAQPEETPEP
jgi:hypothetical protein